MRKIHWAALFCALGLGTLCVTAKAFAGQKGPSNAAGIKEETDDLRAALVKMQKWAGKAETARQQLATTALGGEGRISAQNDLGLDQTTMENYEADVRDDIGCLRDQWKSLTPSERDLVERAEISVE